MPRPRRFSRHTKNSRSVNPRTPETQLPRLIEKNAPLQSSSQLLLMYTHFQSEMPADGKTRISTWLKASIGEYGIPSLIRFGPRSRPRVFRKDEFSAWMPSLATD